MLDAPRGQYLSKAPRAVTAMQCLPVLWRLDGSAPRFNRSRGKEERIGDQFRCLRSISRTLRATNDRLTSFYGSLGQSQQIGRPSLLSY
ncbi:hypothetical protein LTR39_005857, partial [Cryomyces antarcticus]